MATMASGKKIVLFSDFFPPYFGGMENHAAEFYRHFGANGKLSKAFAMIGGEDRGEGARRMHPFLGNALVEQITLESTKKPTEIFSKLEKQGLGEAALFFNSMYWARIFGDLKGKFPDARILLRSGGNDILQSALMDKGKTLGERQQYVVSQINENVDCLVANSIYSKGRFEALGILPSKILVACGGVDVSRFKIVDENEKEAARMKIGAPSGKKLVFSAVRFVPFKSIETTIKAAEKLLELAGDSFTLMIAGDGPLYREMKTLAGQGIAKNNIIVREGIPFSGIGNYYAASDAYLQTPIEYVQKVEGGEYIHTETMGRTFCEAAACGLPTVATKVGGIPEVIEHGATGLLAPALEAGEIAKALEGALYSDERLRLGENARKKAVNEFAWEKLFEKYENAIQGTVHKWQ